MKIEIGNNNKIKNSNIGNGNAINKDKKTNVIIDVLVGLFVTIVGGLIIYYITK